MVGSSAACDPRLNRDSGTVQPMSGGRRPRHVAAAALVCSALVAAACSDGDDATPEPTVAPTTTQAPAPRESDGVLRIGALIPGSDTRVGTSLTDAVEAAAAAINEAGGVLGADVEVTVLDEGTTTATASAAIAELLDDGVDAIVGPASSLTTLGTLDDAVTAGIVTCSPTASAIALDDFPDDRLFFRTIASDSLQAVAIAELAEDTGESEVVIVHVDDAYGRPYAAAVVDALDDLQLDVVDTVPIGVGDDDLDDDMARVVETGAQVAIVLAAATDTARYLDALSRQDYRSFNDLILNDAVRDPAARPDIAALPAALRARLTGVAPQISERDNEGVAGAPFEPQATDCMNVIALAAMVAGSDLPSAIALQIPAVSSGGSVCVSFAECAEELALNQQIDYRGPTGITELNREGETSLARFEVFDFDDEGIDQWSRTFTVGL